MAAILLPDENIYFPPPDPPNWMSAFADLTEGKDGEGADYLLDIIYEKGIRDNNFAADNVSELLFFERGRNSDISVRVITGGTIANPTFSATSVVINTRHLDVPNRWRWCAALLWNAFAGSQELIQLAQDACIDCRMAIMGAITASNVVKN